MMIGELIQCGDFSKYEFFVLIKLDFSGVEMKLFIEFGIDYDEFQLVEIMCGFDLVGDIVDNWFCYGCDFFMVVFCVNKVYVNFVIMQFNKVGINVEVMVVEIFYEEWQVMIYCFEIGVIKIIVSVGVLVVGFDSDVCCIIYVCLIKSEICWLQVLGCGL